MKKVLIEKFDHDARGITHIDGKVTFVENALPNEIVDIELTLENKKYNIAKITEFHEKSANRIDSICPYFSDCGGCDLLHLDYEDTLDFKQDKLKEILSRYAQIEPQIEIVENPNPLNYRNKINLKIKNKKIGFYQNQTHNLIEIDYCYITKDSINKFIKYIPLLNIKNGEITIRSNYNDELLIIINTLDKIELNIDELKLENKIIGIIHNNKTVYGQNFFLEKINNYFFQVSFNSFFQINNYINEKVLNILKNLNFKNQNILDLYCGVGQLGIALAKDNYIYGIEIVSNAIKDALKNIKMNKVTNAKYFIGDTSKVLDKINIIYDTIIVDPPRSGLDKNTLEHINNLKPNNLIYMSCDPMTLARDLNVLKEDYGIDNCYLLDMFSYTNHIECLIVLKSKTSV